MGPQKPTHRGDGAEVGGYKEMVEMFQGDLGPIPTVVCYRDYLLILIK